MKGCPSCIGTLSGGAATKPPVDIRKEAEKKLEIDLSNMIPMDEVRRFGQFASMEYADDGFKRMMRDGFQTGGQAVFCDQEHSQKKSDASKKMIKDLLEANMNT